MAYDPAVNPQALDGSSWRWMTPINLSVQVTLLNDVQASQLARVCVKYIVDGVMWVEPPLSGLREPWVSFMRSWKP